jgi:Protein of unknown function (DUF3237)
MCGKRALTLSGEKSMFEYHLEHILSYTARLGEREVIGPVPEGLRVNVHVTGGEVTGPKVSGKFRSLSGDWVTIRRDGVAILDVRATIETSDGALIYLTYSGTSDRGDDGYERTLQGGPAASGTPVSLPASKLLIQTTYGLIASTASASGG